MKLLMLHKEEKHEDLEIVAKRSFNTTLRKVWVSYRNRFHNVSARRLGARIFFLLFCLHILKLKKGNKATL